MLKKVFTDYYEMVIKPPFAWIRRHPIAWAIGNAIVILAVAAMVLVDYLNFTKRLRECFNFTFEWSENEKEEA